MQSKCTMYAFRQMYSLYQFQGDDNKVCMCVCMCWVLSLAAVNQRPRKRWRGLNVAALLYLE